MNTISTESLLAAREILRKRRMKAREMRMDAEAINRMDAWNANDGRVSALSEAITLIDDVLAGEKVEATE